MKTRNSNIELLRVISIFMIISMHVFGHYQNNLNQWNIACLSFNNAICNMGVSIFMLISGYYGIKFRLEKLFNLWNITFFWSILLLFLDVDHSPKKLICSLFPIFTNKYWFFTSYIIIYCLSSYIENLIHNLTQQQFIHMLGVLLIFFVIAPSFLMIEILRDSGKGIINMLIIYLIGRYISIYGLPKKLTCLRGVTILFIMTTIITVIDFIVTIKTGILFQRLARDNSILIIISSVTLFMLVIQRKPRNVAWINSLASFVFPIYIIHGSIMSRLIYNNENTTYLLYMMVWMKTLYISIIAIALEALRRIVLTKPFNMLLKTELYLVSKIRLI